MRNFIRLVALAAMFSVGIPSWFGGVPMALAKNGGETRITVDAADAKRLRAALDGKDCPAELEKFKELNTIAREAYAALASQCGVASSKPEDLKKKPKPPGEKPVAPPTPKKPKIVIVECVGDAVPNQAKGVCECPQPKLGEGYDGPVAAQEMRKKDGSVLGFCAVTYDDVLKMHAEIDKRLKEHCDPSELDADFDAPAPVKKERAALKGECGRTKSYLYEVLEWKRSFEAKGKPPLTASSWWLMVTRVEDNTQRIDAIEKRLDDLEAKVGTHDEALTNLCEPKEGQTLPEACKEARKDFLAGVFPGGMSPRIGVSFAPVLRLDSGGRHTWGGQIDVGFIGWGKDRKAGLLVRGFAGYGRGWEPNADHLLVGGGLGYVAPLNDEKTMRLIVGGWLGGEPSFPSNAAFNAMGELGLEFAPKGAGLGFGAYFGGGYSAISAEIDGRSQHGDGFALAPRLGVFGEW